MRNDKSYSQSIEKGSYQLGRFIMQLKRLEREPHTFGEAGSLTPSEVHMIDAIGLAGDMLMSEVAARLGVTKGAVTQLIVRLEKKGLVKRKPHPQDARSTILALTSTGEEAYHLHEAMHMQFYAKLQQQLQKEEIVIFEKCIGLLTEMMRKQT